MSNVVKVCKECSDQRKLKTQMELRKRTDPLVGRPVKIAFSHEDEVEHMWVLVTEEKGEKLKGKLSNHPVVVPNLFFGDEVAFTRSEIEELL